eukprot:GHRQ01004596.1.p3 GENE.GHRQ01004596.1~~GHRQ01004596.1.p3  ORF type:complete len:129 (-),score=23.79 GHRQ01004596.1:353-739(-)
MCTARSCAHHRQAADRERAHAILVARLLLPWRQHQARKTNTPMHARQQDAAGAQQAAVISCTAAVNHAAAAAAALAAVRPAGPSTWPEAPGTAAAAPIAESPPTGTPASSHMHRPTSTRSHNVVSYDS